MGLPPPPPPPGDDGAAAAVPDASADEMPRLRNRGSRPDVADGVWPVGDAGGDGDSRPPTRELPDRTLAN